MLAWRSGRAPPPDARPPASRSGLNAASEWKDVRARAPAASMRAQALTHVSSRPQIFLEALKGAIILAVLERLCLTRNSNWLEEHIDYLSLVRVLRCFVCRMGADVSPPNSKRSCSRRPTSASSRSSRPSLRTPSA